jgi:hypothetical protein
MLTLLQIIVRVFQPWKYRLTSIHMTDHEIGIVCGTKEQTARFERILEKKRELHITHLMEEYEQQKVYQYKHGMQG